MTISCQECVNVWKTWLTICIACVQVTVLNLEVGGAFTISGAEEILEALE